MVICSEKGNWYSKLFSLISPISCVLSLFLSLPSPTLSLVSPLCQFLFLLSHSIYVDTYVSVQGNSSVICDVTSSLIVSQMYIFSSQMYHFYTVGCTDHLPCALRKCPQLTCLLVMSLKLSCFMNHKQEFSRVTQEACPETF